MFVPNEPCLSAAFERQPDLLDYAIEQRVLITTPVTLLALLKTVAYGWQQHLIAEHARDITRQAQDLHRRLTAFAEQLVLLGKNLDKSVDGYNETLRVLEQRVLPALDRFQDLGLPTEQLTLPNLIETRINLPRAINVTDVAE